MIVDGDFNSQEDILKDVPGDWESRFEEFVDLNSPVLAEDPNGAILRMDPSTRHAFQSLVETT